MTGGCGGWEIFNSCYTDDMLAAAGPGAHDHYRYVLHVDIEPVEARVLRDAIEDEPFGLRDRYGMPALLRQLDAF